MYKVLVVDDEEIIRLGLSSIIDWEANGFSFLGTAENGVEAYELMMREPADIVITDLKMPVLNGLELIAKVKEENPETVFVILSGYGEFELAKEAMGFGVRHYLLKPCNEHKIVEVLNEIKKEFKENEAKEQEFLRANREYMEKILPLVREQFLRDFITNRAYTQQDLAYYSKLLRIGTDSVRMILCQPDRVHEFEQIFGMIKIIEEVFGEERYLITNIKNQVLALIKAVEDRELIRLVMEAKKLFHNYHHLEVTIAYSEEASFADAPAVYRDLQECLKYSFYLGSGSIITTKDLASGRKNQAGQALLYNYDTVAVAVKSGDVEAVKTEINDFFRQLQAKMYEMSISKTYALELFTVIVREGKVEEMDSIIERLLELQEMNSLAQIQRFLTELGCRVAAANHDTIVTTHNRLVKKIIDYIQENIAEEQLSLKRLANEVVYMNVGYISKLFIRETGEKFSHYLTRKRMEKAKEILGTGEETLVCEVARRVGLGNNPQYFSQLFKKYTGFAPSEYRKQWENSK